jgi:hypothetical protein
MIIECQVCEDQVDIEADSILFPFICKWCVEGYTPYPRYIVQTKSCNSDWSPSDWFRSGNPGLSGLFATKEDAYLAISKEEDGFERRVVLEDTTDDIETGEYNASSSTQQTFAANDYKTVDTAVIEKLPPAEYPSDWNDNIFEETLSPEDDCDQEYISMEDVLAPQVAFEKGLSEINDRQFEIDTMLIEDLEQQLTDANQKSLDGAVYAEMLEGQIHDLQQQLQKEQEYNSVANQTADSLRQELIDAALELSNTKRDVSERDAYTSVLEERIQSLEKKLSAALELATGRELIIDEKHSDIRIYRSLLGLSRMG